MAKNKPIVSPRAPFESIVAGLQGAAWVLHGSLFADGFAGGDTSGWSAAVP